MNYAIRTMKKSEYHLLNDLIYEAIFISEGSPSPPKDIVQLPEVQVYVANFGKEKSDHCFVAEVDGLIVGAVWVRIMNDYGHVDDETPSISIALYKEFRGMGIGTKLMINMLKLLKYQGYKQVSLSVQKANYAVKMYKSLGFETIIEKDEDLIMICKL